MVDDFNKDSKSSLSFPFLIKLYFSCLYMPNFEHTVGICWRDFFFLSFWNKVETWSLNNLKVLGKDLCSLTIIDNCHHPQFSHAWYLIPQQSFNFNFYTQFIRIYLRNYCTLYLYCALKWGHYYLLPRLLKSPFMLYFYLFCLTCVSPHAVSL